MLILKREHDENLQVFEQATKDMARDTFKGIPYLDDPKHLIRGILHPK